MALDDLYQQLLLDHARAPKNRGVLSGDVEQAALLNPVCGDEVIYFMRVKAGSIEDVKFSGHGCMISQAAASMLADELIGKSTEQARALLNEFRATMRGERQGGVPGDLAALEGVKQFPVRIKCALLAFETAAKILSAVESK